MCNVSAALFALAAATQQKWFPPLFRRQLGELTPLFSSPCGSMPGYSVSTIRKVTPHTVITINVTQGKERFTVYLVLASASGPFNILIDKKKIVQHFQCIYYRLFNVGILPVALESLCVCLRLHLCLLRAYSVTPPETV